MTYPAVDAGLPPLKRTYPFHTKEHSYEPNFQSNISAKHQSTSLQWDPDSACFGSIINVKVHPRNVNRLKQISAWPSGTFQFFSLVLQGEFLGLEYGGVKFGCLNKGLCRHLHGLVAENQIRAQVIIPSKDLGPAIYTANDQLPDYLPAEINIYGLKSNAREIGSILSKSGIFLQLPQDETNNVQYYNPHILRIEGYPDFPSIGPSQEPTSSTQEIQDPGKEEPARGNDIVDSIFDSLSYHRILQETAFDTIIKSTLLRHQKKAIDFICQQEGDQIDPYLSLWKYNDVDADEPFYQHVLCGARRPKHAETRGGIFADEMGLGKSLVMISAIAGSLDRAETFVTDENQQRLSQPEREVASKATLIIVPSSLLIDNWVDEIRKHTYPGALEFHTHIGSGRHKKTHYLHDRSIVFTTYATVSAEFHRGDSTLVKINWFRIVLDEAHEIRNRSTKQFQAVAAIPALYRWCLTGTPVHNSLEDLGALISFLRVPLLEKAPTFRKLIINPTRSISRSFDNLEKLLLAVCLRRTRQYLDLPQPVPKLRRLPLTPSEQDDYRELLSQGRMEIDMAASRRGKSNINSAFLESLLKLRLFCNNGRVNALTQPGPTGLPIDPDEALMYLQQHEQNICAYCSGTIYFINEDAVNDGGMFIPGCSHLDCHNCRPYHRLEKKSCPACANQSGSESSTSLPSREMHIEALQSHENNNMGRAAPYPSKLLALLSDIRQNSTHKSIVFSSWKKSLILVSQLLTANSIRHRIIDGSVPLGERLKVLKDFRSPDGANILLMTLGTGAVGLNLAFASRVYLLEPQWNPSIESQAIGRALPLDQTTEVVIMRYIMIGTIEESNVLFGQKRKLELAGGGFHKGKDMQSDKFQALMDVFGVDKNLVAG